MTTASEPAFLADLDNKIFTIRTALSDNDKIAFLRVQQLVGRTVGKYSYLEIGSEQGASLQPHLLDPACVSAVSIDLRPPAQPDERGVLFHHVDNSTARMKRTLTEQIGAAPLEKLTTYDADASTVSASVLPGLVELAMIDAEHTNTACFSDFIQVLSYVKPDSVIAFHDANLILDAIQNAERMLRYLKIEFATVFLPDCVAAIGIRGMAAPVREMLLPHAHERATYVQQSKKQLQQMVAMSLFEAGELPSLRDAATVAQAIEDARASDQTDSGQTIQALRDQVAAATARCTALERAAGGAAARVEALEHSTSWKVTAPLRAVRRLFQ